MVKHRVRGCALAALLGLLALGIGGCWNPFAPPPGDPPPDPVEWDLRDSPQHVLDNLLKAYEHKDAVHYLDCLAEDFTFLVNEDELEDHPELEPGFWGKAEERVIHEEMLGDDGAEDITLTLTQDGDAVRVDGPEPDDPPEWQYNEAVDLRVYVIDQTGPVTLWATAPSMFQFRIDQDQVGPSGETLWEIVLWKDLPGPREDVASDESGDVISLGRLKAMFKP